MRKSVRKAILASLSCATAIGAIPPEALAGPMSVTPPSAVSLSAPTVAAHYYRHWGRRHWGYYRHPHYYRHWGYYRPHYYRHWGYYRPYYHRWGYYRPYYYRRPYYGYPYGYYGYNPGGLFTSAALGLMGAGIAAATAPAWGLGLGWGPGWGWGGGW
jgi:hypothetical protein